MRRDFYFRLTSGSCVRLQSLNETPGRIFDLCHQFEKDHFVVMSDDLIAFYQTCHWPGNLRQFLSHLKKKLVLSNGKKLILDNLDYDLLVGPQFIAQHSNEKIKTLDKVKEDYCQSIFVKFGRNTKKVAKLLNISPNTLKAILKNRKDNQDVIK